MHSSKMLVKLEMGGKYGIYNLLDNQVVLGAEFDYLEYREDDRLVAKKDGVYFEVDNTGKRLNHIVVPDTEWMFIDKRDTCIGCGGTGCDECYGTGVEWNDTPFDLD
ncbi:hypothetical protein ACSX1A_00600 [Pontibacter sp. MBLB2868]|uniref:hypothetical protein n=1 Tax=Pontibacter sp. MBLB2868 TaxID=3451555 RepID=UPI003F74DA38